MLTSKISFMIWLNFIIGVSLLSYSGAKKRQNLEETAIAKPLLLNGDFETGNIFQFDGKEGLRKELQIVSEPVRNGKFALKINCLKSDYSTPTGGNKWRAEVFKNGAGGDSGNHNTIRWFGLSTYLPDDWQNDIFSDIIFQIHERPSACEEYRSPPFYLRANNDKMELLVRWDSKACSDGNTPEGTATIYSVPIVKGRWVDWVFKVKWDYRPNGQGYVEIWQDNVKRTTYYGPNCYNDEKEMYLKTGVYKINGWKNGLTNRALYIDNVQMAGDDFNYKEFAEDR